MPDLVKEVQPIGPNDWIIVSAKYAGYACEDHLPPRNIDFLKVRFNKMANIKQHTGDPSCPPQR